MLTLPNVARGSLEHALAIAADAHAGVLDKAGAPYILHPLRVMMSVEGAVAKIVAVLHDVVEDAPAWSFDRLAAEGFSEDVIDALWSVTKMPDDHFLGDDSESVKTEKYVRFVKRAAAHPIGRVVKRADLDDNLDVTRLKSLTESDSKRINRYLLARSLL